MQAGRHEMRGAQIFRTARTTSSGGRVPKRRSSISPDATATLASTSRTHRSSSSRTVSIARISRRWMSVTSERCIRCRPPEVSGCCPSTPDASSSHSAGQVFLPRDAPVSVIGREVETGHEATHHLARHRQRSDRTTLPPPGDVRRVGPRSDGTPAVPDARFAMTTTPAVACAGPSPVVRSPRTVVTPSGTPGRSRRDRTPSGVPGSQGVEGRAGSRVLRSRR